MTAIEMRPSPSRTSGGCGRAPRKGRIVIFGRQHRQSVLHTDSAAALRAAKWPRKSCFKATKVDA